MKKKGGKIIFFIVLSAILTAGVCVILFTPLMNGYFVPKVKVEYFPLTNFDSTTQEISEEEAKDALGNDYTSPEVIDEDYAITYKKVNAKSAYEDIFAMGANNDILWPGALIDISNEAYKKIDIDRSDLMISGSFESATGRDEDADLAQKVKSPSLSTVRTAIGKIVTDNVHNGVNLANAGISCSIRSIRSEEEFSMNLGLGLRVKLSKLSENFSYKNINKQTNLVMVLKQIFYTIDVDGPGEIKTIDMMQLGKNGQVPAYVSSVSYGRIAIITIQTNYSENEITNMLKGAYGGIISKIEENISLSELAKDSDTTVNCYVYGGSMSDSAGMVNVATGDISSVLHSWGKNIQTDEAVGMPVSYKIRHLDGTMAKIQDSASYVVKQLTYKRQKIASWDYLDSMIMSGQYLKEKDVTIDLSSMLMNSSEVSKPTQSKAERVIKIPDNVEEFTLIGPNNQVDINVNGLSVIVSEREGKPLKMNLSGISFSAYKGESAIKVEGRDELIIELFQKNVLKTEDAMPVIDSPDGKVTIQGRGSLIVQGGDDDMDQGGAIGIRANELIMQSENNIEIRGGNGADGYNGGTDFGGGNGSNGGIGISCNTLNILSGHIKVYGGNGGDGGRGGDGSNGIDAALGINSTDGKQGGHGGNGGNGGSAVVCAQMNLNEMLNAENVSFYGGNGGDGGNGGNGGNAGKPNDFFTTRNGGNGGNGGRGGVGSKAIQCSVIPSNINMKSGDDGNYGYQGAKGEDKKGVWA